MEQQDIEKVVNIYNDTISTLDTVLIGQKKAKSVITAAMLCDANSRILLTGNTGTGKTTISNFLASSFDAERITVTSDMLSSDIQTQLKNRTSLNFLQIDEFNRASGKVQSSLIELFAENQMTIDGCKYQFDDFYVFATQNSADISGVFNVPQAVYDRFDINVYYEKLSMDEKRMLLFEDFEPAKEGNLDRDNMLFTQKQVENFKLNESDQKILLSIFNIIDAMKLNEKNLFAGSNIRAHKYALKLAKLFALTNGRKYILPLDIAEFLNYVYMHRIDQNVARIADEDVEKLFLNTKDQILSLRRHR